MTIGINHVIFVSFIIFWACVNHVTSRTLHGSYAIQMHQKWVSQYKRYYVNDTEKSKRLEIFRKNMEFIDNFNKNAKNRTYELGLNQFADLTNEEFIALHTGLHNSIQKSFRSNVTTILAMNDIPESIDWRKKGAVTNVKNQGGCGSCWIFATVGAIEGINKIKTGNLISLSEQQVLDCSKSGCEGGNAQDVYEYVIKNRGISGENDYPYQEYEGTCHKATPLVKISGFKAVENNNEEQLKIAVANQPVSVAITADENFRFYRKGLFNGPCAIANNHMVTAIGYGISKEGTKYWLVKNSWGPGWGVDGYMLLQRDIAQPEGLCGIAMDASYPTVA